MKELNKSSLAKLVGYAKADTISNWEEGFLIPKRQRKDKIVEPKEEIKDRFKAIKIGATFIHNGFEYAGAIALIDENEELKKEILRLEEGMNECADKFEQLKGLGK